jgi:hypothetical protein
MYTDRNFKTKKELKDAVAAWNARASYVPGTAGTTPPRAVTYHQPGPFGGETTQNGTVYCEGPHFPQPHKWYAACTVKDGVIIKVK